MCRNPGGGLRDIKEGHTGAISVQQAGANHGAAQQRLEPIMEQHNRGWSQSWSSTTEAGANHGAAQQRKSGVRLEKVQVCGSLGCSQSQSSTLKRTLTNHCLVKSP
ncbi:unnamed protein product [Knipowitschia caucasica]